MISGALLEAYCPDNGDCMDASISPARHLRQTLSPSPPVTAPPCNGAALWTIIGLITLSSPLLILITQRWVRPSPDDFHSVGMAAQFGSAVRRDVENDVPQTAAANEEETEQPLPGLQEQLPFLQQRRHAS
jgi:hypothetical protein